MTGQKNRYKTTEKLWDLDDKQLKTPKHDAMVLWLMDNLYPYHSKIFNEIINERDVCDVQISSEVPIMSSNTFIAGYGDIVVIPVVRYIDDDYDPPRKIIHKEKPLSVLIEVKPYIDSFGAVLRQLRTYGRFWKHNSYQNMCLFTLDDRFDSQFESQGIIMLHPPESVSIDDMIDRYL